MISFINETGLNVIRLDKRRGPFLIAKTDFFLKWWTLNWVLLPHDQPKWTGLTALKWIACNPCKLIKTYLFVLLIHSASSSKIKLPLHSKKAPFSICTAAGTQVKGGLKWVFFISPSVSETLFPQWVMMVFPNEVWLFGNLPLTPQIIVC